MQLGATSVDVVSDGTYLLDGGCVFGQVPRSHWELQMKPDRRNRIRLALNCLLIRIPELNILVDTGAGSKRIDRLKDACGLNGNKLLKGLKKLGLTARDIDIVVLTHLHFDVGGGCTKLDRTGKAMPAFPKAKYMVQRESWQEASNPNERGEGTYSAEDYLPLEENGVLSLLDGDTEIAPGVRTRVTNGHCRGHQVVLVEAGSERIAYMADLIPTPHHVSLTSIAAFDQTPNETLEKKRELVGMALDKGWLMVFGHAHNPCGAYIEQRNGRAQLLPVDI